jgi:hypothetical protein
MPFACPEVLQTVLILVIKERICLISASEITVLNYIGWVKLINYLIKKCLDPQKCSRGG